jgi:hypothetical protein
LGKRIRNSKRTHCAEPLVMSVYCCRSFFHQNYRDTLDSVAYESFAGRFATGSHSAWCYEVDSITLLRKIPDYALYIVRLRRLDDLTSKIVWFFLAATLWLLGVLSSPAYPSGSKGHEIGGGIAETHLTDTARRRIKSFSRKARR